MEKVFLIGDDINLLSSFEAKLGLENYSVFINSVTEPLSSISLNILLNKPLFLIFFLHEDSIASLEVLADLKLELHFEIPIFVVGENFQKAILEKLDLLNIKYFFDLHQKEGDEIIQKILKIRKNIL